MKRMETSLEKSFISNGWRLVYKTYTGKKSQFIRGYVYEKNYSRFIGRVELNSKRTNVICYTMSNNNIPFLDGYSLQDLDNCYKEIEKDIHYCSQNANNEEHDPLEVIETLEAIEE